MKMRNFFILLMVSILILSVYGNENISALDYPIRRKMVLVIAVINGLLLK